MRLPGLVSLIAWYTPRIGFVWKITITSRRIFINTLIRVLMNGAASSILSLWIATF